MSGTQTKYQCRLPSSFENVVDRITQRSGHVSVAPAREGRTWAALGAGAGVSSQQADEKDQEAGERHHHQAADFRAGNTVKHA